MNTSLVGHLILCFFIAIKVYTARLSIFRCTAHFAIHDIHSKLILKLTNKDADGKAHLNTNKTPLIHASSCRSNVCFNTSDPINMIRSLKYWILTYHKII